MNRSPLAIAISCAIIAPSVMAEVTPADLPTMVISADFRPNEAQDIPASLTVIDQALIESRGGQHVEDILNLAPNVNVSSGAARGQYFQIRGIGERSQFAAPLNPSVGLNIDGIDFSRTGGAATLFDIESVEVLRGPQGTKFGTNGLAGTINLKSTEPTEEFDMKFESTLAEYNTRAVGVAVGGSLIENTLLGRFSVHDYQSDGYMDNDYLHRDNTQNRDEITARGHLKWLVNSDLTVDLNLLHLNIDNGYDAFTLDNTRHSQSDMPGEDSQHTNAFALKTDYRASSALQLQSSFTYAKSDIVYSYDADWGFAGQFAPALFPYIGFEEFKRDRENYSVELKALSNEDGRIFDNSTDWTLGFYHLDQSEVFSQDSDFGVFGATYLEGSYDTKNTAVFGQLDTHLTDKLTLISGLRLEYFDGDYHDFNKLEINPDEWLFGGKLGVEYALSEQHQTFITASRGYKSGGVNNDARISPSQREFDTEYLWSLEAGIKSEWLQGDLVTNVVSFYSWRRNAQVKSSFDIGPQFVDYIDNAAKGRNAGLEADFDWLLNNNWRAFGAVGLLYTTYDKFENPDLLTEGVDLKGRRQAHAPTYQFTLGGEYYVAPGWTLRANMEGKDEFYYSNSHNSKSHSYVLYNASVEYARNDWKLTLWGRNLFDKDYYTRGFFFANNPGNGYVDQTYVQYGDPRVIGLTVSYDY